MQITKHKQVPALRFPEFEGDWERIKLGEIASKVGSGSTPKGGDKVYTTTGIPFIRSQNVTDNTLQLREVCFIPEEVHQKMKGSTVKANDILLNITGASIGRSCVVPKDFDQANVNQHVCIIRLKKDYIPRFLQPILASHKGQNLIYKGQTGSGREGINFASIRAFRISFPSLPEQQKIANFLALIDKKISLLQEKKQQLQQFKKGMMQQLFSQKKRFLEENGDAFPDWETTNLGKIAIIRKGFTPSTKNTSYWGGQNKWLSIRDMKQGKFITNTSKKITDIAIKGKQVIEKGTLLMSFKLTLGKVAITKTPVFTNEAICNFEWKRKNIITEYMYHYLNFTDIESFGSKAIKGVTLNNDSLSAIVIKLPDYEEQEKIANCLNAVDQQIQKVKEQLEETQHYKRGLLQQLLV